DPGHPTQAASQIDRGDPVKVVNIQGIDLEQCIQVAQKERVVLAREGQPVALLIGIGPEGLEDLEDQELVNSAELWPFIDVRRAQPTMTRDELDGRLGEP